MSKVSELMIDLLEGLPAEGVTYEEMTDLFGGPSRNTLKRALAALEEVGLVERIFIGRPSARVGKNWIERNRVPRVVWRRV